MCGICGIIGDNVTPELLRGMTRALVHRGPDDEGVFLDSGFGMGARRLSIIDIPGGNQPFESEDSRFALIYNGETYNHDALRRELESRGHKFRSHCDTEAVLHVLEEDALEGVKKLRGIFAFALWDRVERKLVLGRDRLGVKPLYYYYHGSTFAFASEIKALLQVPKIRMNLSPDFEALHQIMVYNFPLGTRTAFNGINELLPGHLLIWQDGRIRMRQYWDIHVPRQGEEANIDEATAAEQLIELVRESTRMRLMSDVPLATFLSGGIDSSIITACAREIVGPELKTFALSFDVPLWDESEKARSVAEYLGVDHREVPCSPGMDILPRVMEHLEQPQRWSGTAGIFKLYEVAGHEVKVVLTGEGSDEIFGGYPHLTEFPLRCNAQTPTEPLALYLAGLANMTPERQSALFTPEFLSKVSGGERQAAPGRTGGFFLNPSRIEGLDPLNIGLYLDIKLRLVKFITFMLDRLSMAHGVEARVPFLDHKLVEFAMKLPPSMKVRPPFSKYILRRAGSGLLPREMLDRPKQGFVEPLDHWMRGELPPGIVHALAPGTIREKGYFVTATVMEMLARHRANVENCGYDLIGVALTHIWDDLFIAGKPVAEIEAGQ